MNSSNILNPLQNLPLNTLKQYVRGIDHSGCQIFMPVHTTNDLRQKMRQKELQDFLNSQPLPYVPPAPITA